jgi:translation initiation factor IF-1
MVKNTKGGNKSKGMARKYAAGAREQRVLRLSSCDLETYGVVTRILGNGMFYVTTEMQPQLLGHIRNKFRGRSKRDNTITLGSVVLVGLREWEHPNYKECDLLEVYEANEVRQLMKNPSINFSELQKHIDTYSRGTGDAAASVDIGAGADIEFAEDRDYNDGLIPEEDPTATTTKEIHKEDIVDFDDI